MAAINGDGVSGSHYNNSEVDTTSASCGGPVVGDVKVFFIILTYFLPISSASGKCIHVHLWIVAFYKF